MTTTVLVIDDDRLVRDSLNRVLSKAGFTVLTAENGARGIQILAQNNASVVVTDIIMPEMEGIQTIQELRKQWPNLPIIAISGGGRRGNLDFLKAAAAFGARAVLQKPFSNDDLVSAVRTAIAS